MNSINFKKFYFLLFTAVVFYACSKEVYNNRWQGRNVIADGKTQEWDTPLRYYDAKSKMQFVISNDSTNLYVAMRATDEIFQLKILRAGMQLWIDTTGKKRGRTSIFFPIAGAKMDRNMNPESMINEEVEESGNNSKPGTNSLKNWYLREPKQMELHGFKFPIGGITPLKNDFNISVNIDWDKNGIMNYEAIIPFKTFYKDALSAADSSKVFSFSIIIPALPTPNGVNTSNSNITGMGMNSNGGGMNGSGMNNNGMNGGMNGGSGGMNGGGMNGGGYGSGYGTGYGGGSNRIDTTGTGYGNFAGRTSSSSPLYSENKISMKIKLAVTPK